MSKMGHLLVLQVFIAGKLAMIALLAMSSLPGMLVELM